jgi:hypothetical protein
MKANNEWASVIIGLAVFGLVCVVVATLAGSGAEMYIEAVMNQIPMH